MGIWLRVERTAWSVSGVVEAWVGYTLYIYIDSLMREIQRNLFVKKYGLSVLYSPPRTFKEPIPASLQ